MKNQNSIFGYPEMDDECDIYIEELTPARHKFKTTDEAIFDLNSFICNSYCVNWELLEGRSK